MTEANNGRSGLHQDADGNWRDYRGRVVVQKVPDDSPIWKYLPRRPRIKEVDQ